MRNNKVSQFRDWTNPDGSVGGQVEKGADVAPDAVIHGFAKVLSGAVVGAGAIINRGAIISSGSFVQAGEIIPEGTLVHGENRVRFGQNL